MSSSFVIVSGGFEVPLELTEEPFRSELSRHVPLESRVSRWGDEIYFPVPVEVEATSLTRDVEAGDVAFWHEGQSLAVFFGPTPLSDGDKPVPADDVEPVGRVRTGLDQLSDFDAGQAIKISQNS